MRICLTIIIFMSSTQSLAQALNATDASVIWRGSLLITCSGSLSSQGLANKVERIQSNDVPTVFIKEKSHLSLDHQIEISFWFNERGEYGSQVRRSGKAQEEQSLEKRKQYLGEEAVAGQRMKIQQLIKEVTIEKGSAAESWDEQWLKEFPGGKLKLIPEVKSRKKGKISLTFEGSAQFELKGQWEKVFDKQPDPKNNNYKKELSDYVHQIGMPLSFDFEVEFKKKVVAGSFDLKYELKNPFASDLPELEGNQKMQSDLKLTGTYRLEPQF